jgi:hypothetical protein
VRRRKGKRGKNEGEKSLRVDSAKLTEPGS